MATIIPRITTLVIRIRIMIIAVTMTLITILMMLISALLPSVKVWLQVFKQVLLEFTRIRPTLGYLEPEPQGQDRNQLHCVSESRSELPESLDRLFWVSKLPEVRVVHIL